MLSKMMRAVAVTAFGGPENLLVSAIVGPVPTHQVRKRSTNFLELDVTRKQSEHHTLEKKGEKIAKLRDHITDLLQQLWNLLQKIPVREKMGAINQLLSSKLPERLRGAAT